MLPMPMRSQITARFAWHARYAVTATQTLAANPNALQSKIGALATMVATTPRVGELWG
jgi:hypothetical protein